MTFKKLIAVMQAALATTVDTFATPQVAFAEGPSQMTFADHFAARKMAMDISGETEVRDPKAVAMITGKNAVLQRGSDDHLRQAPKSTTLKSTACDDIGFVNSAMETAMKSGDTGHLGHTCH